MTIFSQEQDTSNKPVSFAVWLRTWLWRSQAPALILLFIPGCTLGQVGATFPTPTVSFVGVWLVFFAMMFVLLGWIAKPDDPDAIQGFSDNADIVDGHPSLSDWRGPIRRALITLACLSCLALWMTWPLWYPGLMK